MANQKKQNKLFTVKVKRTKESLASFTVEAQDAYRAREAVLHKVNNFLDQDKFDELPSHTEFKHLATIEYNK